MYEQIDDEQLFTPASNSFSLFSSHCFGVVVGSERNLKGTWKSANLTWTCLIHGP